jgi:poly(ribitol-phosphate) beta-N-acetylglucosaminyltransferase
MTVRVSVIVPVFNPGAAFDALIESLDRQTLGTDAFEVVLCDDGSDEPTRERLAAVARTRPNIRVLYLPHTGWPGTPRNRGVDTAAGEYVYFVDQDDRLFPAALQKLCDFADTHRSDVVIGKEVGVGRRLPRAIFSRDIPRAVLGKDPILELLTPHKLFRTSFLRANGIRFPDGKVRLEDHLFVMQAYFRAETISVLASEACYAWVKHRGSASASRIDPTTYFPHLEAVLDIVEANTEPGELRDSLLRHWLRGKILKRLSGRQMVRYSDDHRDRLLDVVTPLVQKRFGPGVDDGLELPHRVRVALLRAGRRSDLRRLAAYENDMACGVTATSAAWSRGGGLDLTLEIRVTHDGQGAPMLVSSDADPERVSWRPPVSFEGMPPSVLDAGTEFRRDRVDLFLRHAEDEVERRAGGRRVGRWRTENPTTARLSVDPLKVFSRGDRSRGGQLFARVRRVGWTFDVPLISDARLVAATERSPILSGRACRLEVRDDGTVWLRRDWPRGELRDIAGRVVRRLRAGVAKRSPGRRRGTR